MAIRRGAFCAGEKAQLTDRKMDKITIQLIPGGYTQTGHGFIMHDDIIGVSEGSVITTADAQRAFAENPGSHQDASGAAGTPYVRTDEFQDSIEPWRPGKKLGGWKYCAMRPRTADYVLSMPRGAQIMYPKDIAQVLQLGDIRGGMRVLESGGGSGAMSISLLEAVGSDGEVTTIEIREEFARICKANATVFYGYEPSWWKVAVGSFDICCAGLPENYYDRIVLDMLDPWNRLEQAYRVISPGGVLVCYVTTVTQVSRLAERLRSSGTWTEPEITETIERTWKADGLAVRPNHQMIGHTGFIVVSRAMAYGHAALRKKGRAFKDTHTDIDSAASADGLDSLELRDMSDRKVRKVLRDLDGQVSQLHNPRLYTA